MQVTATKSVRLERPRPGLKPWATIAKPAEGAVVGFPLAARSLPQPVGSPGSNMGIAAEVRSTWAIIPPQSAPSVGFGFSAHGFSPGRVRTKSRSSLSDAHSHSLPSGILLRGGFSLL